MPTPRAGVLVVGSLNVDLVVRAARLPVAGETVTGGTFARFGGGKGANQAVAAARFGAAVTFVGAVGNDELGRDGLDALRAEAIDTSRALVVPRQSTGVALIVVDDHGENQIAVASGANAALDGVAVDETLAALDEADRARLAGGVVLANLEIADDAVLAAGLFAGRNRMRFVLNPAPARPLPASIIELGPVLVPNRGEAATLAGAGADGELSVEAAARRLAEQTGGAVIVTLGADGALVWDGETATPVAAPAVEAVDTTGAGDTFCGVLAAALADGLDLIGAATLAARAASMSVTVAGAREGMPRRAEMEERRTR